MFDRKEYMKIYHKENYQQNRAKLDEINKRWVKNNPVERKNIGRKYTHSLLGNYNSAKQSAKHRKIHFGLTFDDFSKIRIGNCYYCGRLLPATGGGLDRIDSNLGYAIENVRPCCASCNYAKRHLSEKEFFDSIRRIYECHFK